MNKWLKIIITLAVIGIIAAGLGYKFIYNKPHKNYETATPDYGLTIYELFSEYRNDRQDSEQKYNGKVIVIAGKLDKVESLENMTIAVFVLEEGMFGDEGIRCTMLPNHVDNIASLIGENIKLKGYCTGYNDTDVIIEKCSLIK